MYTMYIYPYEYINAQIEYMKYLFIHLKFEITIPIPSRAKAPAQNMACSPVEDQEGWDNEVFLATVCALISGWTLWP